MYACGTHPACQQVTCFFRPSCIHLYHYFTHACNLRHVLVSSISAVCLYVCAHMEILSARRLCAFIRVWWCCATSVHGTSLLLAGSPRRSGGAVVQNRYLFFRNCFVGNACTAAAMGWLYKYVDPCMHVLLTKRKHLQSGFHAVFVKAVAYMWCFIISVSVVAAFVIQDKFKILCKIATQKMLMIVCVHINLQIYICTNPCNILMCEQPPDTLFGALSNLLELFILWNLHIVETISTHTQITT